MSSIIRPNYYDHIGYIWNEYEEVFITNVCFKEIQNFKDLLFGILKNHYA